MSIFNNKSAMKEKTILSGIRATGRLHLGNYFGALQQFLDLQKSQNTCYFFVADLHALTTIEKPINLEASAIDVIRSYIACGIDPQKSFLYRQSSIPEIPYLSTLFSMIAHEGLLRRCTTFKEKSHNKSFTSLGLLSYPVLMSADILIVKGEVVPVGEDQLQHLEMCRDLAQKFNRLFRNIFPLPTAQKLESIRIPALDGSGKMGKSFNNTIDIVDTAEVIRKKVMAAVTDTNPVKGQKMTTPMKNIYQIMKLCSPLEVYEHYYNKYKNGEQKFYGNLKKQLADDIIALLTPIREKYESAECQPSKIKEIMHDHTQKVRIISKETLGEVVEALGISLNKKEFF